MIYNGTKVLNSVSTTLLWLNAGLSNMGALFQLCIHRINFKHLQKGRHLQSCLSWKGLEVYRNPKSSCIIPSEMSKENLIKITVHTER